MPNPTTKMSGFYPVEFFNDSAALTAARTLLEIAVMRPKDLQPWVSNTKRLASLIRDARASTQKVEAQPVMTRKLSETPHPIGVGDPWRQPLTL